MNAMTQLTAPGPNDQSDQPHTHDARTLIGDQQVQARILLDEQVYWLRITRSGKLILTK